MTPADTALSLLRESRDGAHIWTDGGATIERLAAEAGVTVRYAHVALGKEMTVEYRTVEGKGAGDARVL